MLAKTVHDLPITLPLLEQLFFQGSVEVNTVKISNGSTVNMFMLSKPTNLLSTMRD
jgi:hypothetical protein